MYTQLVIFFRIFILYLTLSPLFSCATDQASPLAQKIVDDSNDNIMNQIAKEEKKPKNMKGIIVVDKNTFRILGKSGQIWDELLEVLIQNYNINVVDKSSGVITTEWDSFYSEGRVYRNKISALLKRVSFNTYDIKLVNNVEELSDGSTNNSGSSWLPSKNELPELGRIIQNLSSSLNLPAPELPEEMTSRAVTTLNRGDF